MRFMYVVWVLVMVIFRWLPLFSSIETTLIDELQSLSTNYTATCLPSRKLSKLDEPDTQDTAGEAGAPRVV